MKTHRSHTAHSRSITSAAPTRAGRIVTGQDGDMTSANNIRTAPKRCCRQTSEATLDIGNDNILAASANRRASSSSSAIASPQKNVDHGKLQFPASSSSTAPNVVNIQPNFSDAPDASHMVGNRYPGWACALILFTLIVATWSAIYFIVTAALSLGSGT